MLHNPNKNKITNFFIFLCLIWQHFRLPTPDRAQRAISVFLQHGPKKKVLLCFRGLGKTWITAAYVVFRLYLNPQLKIMIVSASSNHSKNISIFIRRIIEEIDFLKHLSPRKHQRDTQTEFDVGPARSDPAPSVRSVGITGQMTGGRADIIIADDIEIPTNSETQEMRSKIEERVKEFAAILKPEGETIWLGTPQTEMSLYNTLPEKGYTVKIWPARYPNAELLKLYGDKLFDRLLKDLEKNPNLGTFYGEERGAPTVPGRFSNKVLIEKEIEYRRSGFQLQFMLNTSLSDALKYPLKLKDLIFMELNPFIGPQQVIHQQLPHLEITDKPNVGLPGDKMYRPYQIQGEKFIPYTGSILYIDPSGRGTDQTAYSVIKVLHGQFFLMDVGGFIDGYSEETLTALAEKAKEYKVNIIGFEDNFGDGLWGLAFTPYLSKIYPCTLEGKKEYTNKEHRIIQTMEAVMNSHNLIVDSKLIEKDYHSVDNLDVSTEKQQMYRFFYQLTRITKERGSLQKDDKLDAVRGGIHYLSESIALDTEHQRQQEEIRQIQEELEKESNLWYNRSDRTNNQNDVTLANWLIKLRKE